MSDKIPRTRSARHIIAHISAKINVKLNKMSDKIPSIYTNFGKIGFALDNDHNIWYTKIKNNCS